MYDGKRIHEVLLNKNNTSPEATALYQMQATVAVAEQLRIANLIKACELGLVEPEVVREALNVSSGRSR